MQFIKKNLSTDMIEDNVFKVVNLAKIAKQRNPEGVVDATIGSLFDEEGRLVALNTVFDVYNQLPNTDKAAYAQGFAGNKDYLEWINKEIVGNAHFSLPHQAIATVGGSGAISLALSTTLEAKDSVIAPNIAWGSYKLMAENLNLGYETYNLLDENHFDLTSFKETCLRVAEKQDKLFIIINDP
ncbi:MAG: aminotransferase class I/II-fold pyridoxal phosphate-dependent enzyme, partial [Erysipelotrichaceae bacterium]